MYSLNLSSYHEKHKYDKNYDNKAKFKYIEYYAQPDECKFSRKAIADEYLLEVEPSVLNQELKCAVRAIKCNNCDIKLRCMSPGTYNCEKCMKSIIINIENTIVTSVNTKSISTINSYQKSKYFDTLLKRFQMIQTPKNGDKILKKIRNYMETYNIEKTPHNIRQALKQCKHSILYTYISFFVSGIIGIRPKPFSEVARRSIKKWFNEILDAWNIIYGTQNKTFFNYTYIFIKLVEYLEDYDEYLFLVPLPNTLESLDKNDKLFTPIREYLRWEPIPTYKR